MKQEQNPTGMGRIVQKIRKYCKRNENLIKELGDKVKQTPQIVKPTEKRLRKQGRSNKNIRGQIQETQTLNTKDPEKKTRGKKQREKALNRIIN